MTALLNTAIDAAQAAGEVLLERLPHERTVTYKGPRDIVTDADLEAQRTIAALIAARFPDHALLDEEGPHLSQADLRSTRPLWIIDPLDGTSNYSRRLPGFSVSVAVAEAGQVLAGVTYDPLRQETFCAERGQGAFLRQGRAAPQPLRVSGTRELAQAIAGLDWARDPTIRARVLTSLGRVGAACRTVRALGSAALGVAYVAAGRLDVYYHLSVQPWDAAAGWLLVSEAGGRVTSPGGRPWSLEQRALAASNGPLHAAFIDTLGLGPD
jgi:myo-inositol-1(or 4)-monophosphatase